LAVIIWIDSAPLDSAADKVHQRYKDVIVDKNVYETSAGCYPATDPGYTFGVSGVTANQQVQVVHNGESIQSLIGQSSYRFSIVPMVGRNSVYAEQGGVQSNQLVFTTDLLQTMVFPLPKMLRDREDEVRQGWADSYLSTGNVSSANSVAMVPSMRALLNTWGTWLDAPNISGYTRTQYITLLQTVLDIYQRGAVAKSMSDVGSAIGDTSGTGSSVFELFDEMSTVGANQPLVYGSGGTGVTITAGKVHFDNRSFNVSFAEHVPVTGGSISNQVEASGDVFVVVDLALSGVNTSGTVTPVVTTSSPSVVMANFFEEFDSSRIQTDADGVVTGLIDGKYVILNRVPLEILSVSGSPYLLSGGSRVLLDSRDRKTACVDLGTRVSVDELVTGSTIDITYRALRKNVKVLSRVVCALESTANTITGITDIRNLSRPSHGALYSPSGRFKRSFLVMLSRDDDLGPHTESEKEFAKSVLRKNSPVGSQGYVYFNRTPELDPYQVQSSGDTYLFWLRANSITGVSHGGDITDWDSNITGITATGSTINPPIYLTGGTPAGGPVVRLGGVDGTDPSYFDLPLNTLDSLTGFTLFSVVKNNYIGNVERQDVFSGSGEAGTDFKRALTYRVPSGKTRIGSIGQRILSDDASTIEVRDNVVSPLQFSIDCSVFDYQNAVIYQYQNGVKLGQVSMDSTGYTGNLSSTAMTISSTGDTAFYGDISEVLGIDGALPEWKVRQISNWLYTG